MQQVLHEHERMIYLDNLHNSSDRI